MQIKLRGKRVAVEKIKKRSGKKEGEIFYLPDSEEYLGLIKFIGPDTDPELKIGQKVYFSTNFQTARIAGTEVCIMNDTEVYAIAEAE